MYGVIALFDDKTEKVIKEIWKDLKEKSISNYAYEVENRRPHITLASYTHIDKKTFMKQMDELYENKKDINITFSSIGSFLKSGTLFFSPIVTKELFEFHTNHHLSFNQYSDNPNSLYLPKSWIPHCTIANRLSPDKLLEAFNYCINRNDIISGKIKEVAIIEVSKPNVAPIIWSREFKKGFYEENK